MLQLIDTTLGMRDYLNGAQLLFGLPRPPDMTRVRVRFRRLATCPGYWSPRPAPGAEETCRAILSGPGGVLTFHFLSRPDLWLKRGGPEAHCLVEVTRVVAGPLIPRSAEARFEGAVWPAAIRLTRLIGPDPGPGKVWLPVSAEGDVALLDPTLKTGRIGLRHTQDRRGIHLLQISIDELPLMDLGVACVTRT